MNNSNFHKFLHRFNPVVSKRWLLILAGLMWSGVGIMLIRLALVWLSKLALPSELMWGIAGVVLAGIVYRFGFSNIAHKNIRRIKATADKACVFGFQEWKSYGIIVIMMTTGIILRSSSLPRELLALIYLTVGGGLLLSSIHYYQHFTFVSAMATQDNR